nr:helix-turn-helix domain-containing protein [uncultured Novosphingobium sp.]
MTKLLCDIAQAGEMLSVGRSKVYELMDRGVLKSVKIGQRRLIKIDSIVSFVGTLNEVE